MRVLFPRETGLIAAAWVILGFIFTGLGALVRRSWGAPARDADEWLTCFWLGWTATVFVLQVWQLAAPVDRLALASLGAIGAVGVVTSGATPWRVLLRGLRTSLPALLAFALVVAWLANRSLGGPQNGDTGLYHIPTVRWLASHAIVPGLGNLYVAYAFNHSYLLYVALLDVGPFSHGAHHLANSILLLVLCGHVLRGVWRAVGPGPCRAEHLFYGLFLPAAAGLALDINFTSPSPDFPVFVIGIVLTGHLIRLLTAPDAPVAADFLTIVALAALGLTVKLSLGGLALTTVAVAGAWWLWKTRRFGTVVAGAGVGALGVVPLMIRGVILSGYPLYPSTVAGAPVAWRVPPEAGTWILGVSQIPGSYSLAFTSPQWFFTWLATLGWTERAVWLPLAIAAVLLPVGLVVRLVRRPPGGVPLLVLVPALAQFVFLFLAAPRARYGGALFWMLAVETTLVVLGSAPRGARALAITAALALAVLPFRDGPPALRRLSSFEPMPRPALSEVRLATGLVVQFPGESQCCWDAPLPCTPEPNQALRLRRDGDLGSGFVLDPNVTPGRAVPDSPPA